MAKFENELDPKEARRLALKKKNEVMSLIGANKLLSKNIDTLVANKSIICYIFSKSIAFRIGKSSVKNISGYSSGFKTSLTGTSINEFKNLRFGSGKKDEILLAACYFLIEHPDRTKSESDKTEAAESEQVVNTTSALEKLINNYGSVRLMVGTEVYEVDGFKQVSGRPKADMVFTMGNNSVIYVSHKKGARPGDFQQYGGFSSDLGLKNEADVKSIPIIRKFVESVEELFQAFNIKRDEYGRYDFNRLNKGSNFAALLNDEEMAYTVMFGKDYMTRRPGLDNCSILIDGDIIFQPVKGKGSNVFELKGSYHEQVNPSLDKHHKAFKSDPTDIYAPVMFLIKSEQQGLNQAGFSNVRAVIWPNNKVTSSYAKKFAEILSAIKSKNTNKITEYRNQMVKA